MRGFAVGIAIVAAGCGGIVVDHDRDGGVSNSGAAANEGGTNGKAGGTAKPGTGGRSGTGAAGSHVNLTCGNGVLDPDEECDSLVQSTCATVTMGARPFGTIKCTPTCTFDSSGCTGSIGAGGFVGTGGVTGRGGGATATGGRLGSGGVSFSECETTSSLLTNDCTEDCGCKFCPDVYAACKRDGGCSWVLACAQQNGCVSVDTCYQTPCKSIIDRAGGKSSPGATLGDPALACLAKSGCGVTCN
ncbi:MAG TPA: hypothetical protein VHU80_04605 [Polyangiaceae bacterium]|nr:hypothetical protein [Polyangiaceae bacterium]